jgi:hypothetical protein
MALIMSLLCGCKVFGNHPISFFAVLPFYLGTLLGRLYAFQIPTDDANDVLNRHKSTDYLYSAGVVLTQSENVVYTLPRKP